MSLLSKFVVQWGRERLDIFAKRVLVANARFGSGFGIGECCGVGFCIVERFVTFGICFGVGRKVTVGGETWHGDGACDRGCGLSGGRAAIGGAGGGGGIPMSR
ncbi:hypothetical protein QVD17_30697 [Tagetes erecta]|uniref:Uncharacterized protein n=1 Tax=Tagetes erecta TaxID=13708 RepID=A0AAD8NN79_TARER|nr:hypothetical protein QVD17_30697 [Tagetes erecta]